MNEQDYFAQFAGDTDIDKPIVIQTDEDLDAFKRLIRIKWASEHAGVIEEWWFAHDTKCPDCEWIKHGTPVNH